MNTWSSACIRYLLSLKGVPLKVNRLSGMALIVLGLLLALACAPPPVSQSVLPDPTYSKTPPKLEGVLDRESHLPDATMGRTTPNFEYHLPQNPYLPEPSLNTAPPSFQPVLEKTPSLPDTTFK